MATFTRHDTIEPLIALFEEDGFKSDEHSPEDRVVTMRHRGQVITLDLDNYGITLVLGASKSGFGGSWGTGPDLDAAKRSFTAAGGALAKPYSIVEFDPETLFIGVNGMGYYQFLGDPPAVGQSQPHRRSA